MSGHSKWHSIKHKKGAADAKRGKIFTKHAKLITIAARDGGADPEMNPGLRSAITNAKADNVPNANIDKAVKKGAGGDKDGAQLVEIMYEGFGPAGTVMYVQVITDNKNRSVASVKTCFTKSGGNMGAAGSVGWMFERKGMLLVKASGEMGAEEAELAIIDSGAEDLSFEDGVFEVVSDASELMQVRDNLEKAGLVVTKAEITYLAKDEVRIDDEGEAKKVLKLMESLEDDDDVANVYSNFDIAEEILEKI